MKEPKTGKELFDRLADQWFRETGMHSNPHFIKNNDAFRGIVNMGEEALPHIFQRIASEERGLWWMPLEQITGIKLDEGVTDIEGAPGWVKTDVTTLKQAWLRWGIKHGYISLPDPGPQKHHQEDRTE